MLSTETKRQLDEIRKYIKKWYDYSKELNELITDYDNKKVNVFTYISRKKNYTKETVKSEILIDIINRLEKFSVSKLSINNNTVRTINSFLPFLSSNDQEEIIKFFEKEENKVQEEDKKELEEIKAQSKLMEKNLTNPQFRYFITAINEQERILYNHVYNSFDFKKESKTNEEEYISTNNQTLLKNLKKLISEGKIQNRSIEKNIIQITKAFGRIGKLRFINSKIDEALENLNNDSEELKVILERIKEKNEKRIEKLEKDLEHFNLEDVCKEATILDEEKKRDDLKQERLSIYERLTYELMKAKDSRYNDEIIDGLEKRLNDLDFYLTDDEKNEIENRVIIKLAYEKTEKLKQIQEKTSETKDEKSTKKM